MGDKNNVIFDLAIRTADMIVKMFGDRCEVAVHDFTDLQHSLIHLAGNVTGRKIGSPITDLVLNELTKKQEDVQDIPSYKTQSKQGKVLKSSTVFLRDDKEKIIGALCMNYDISLFIQFGGEIEQFINFQQEKQATETFFNSVHDVIHEMVDRVILDHKKAPVEMSIDEKVDCVRILDEKGVFLIKGATEYVAQRLGVSKFTIYNYLHKVRSLNEYQVEVEK
ncbi:helix-turn-helix transcriptional regulator [Cerasibacillus sp. JNUCC 74]|jgi:predicted transcriptional regulator YheO|uniref:helix-turn-helix transcriptional regulator n=1 Tax=Virgibacillus proomii TaxID=84407 RepID=UPI0009875FE5|nr:PAS domain-containing protein [Virgibacillus proomii]